MKSPSRVAASAPLAVHSYLHMSRRLGVHPYFKFRQSGPAARNVQGENPWSVPALCAAYNWPTGLTGGGVIAIVELGGGWVQSDMDQFFGGISQPVPKITDVSVDSTKNTPDPGPNSADGEVALDIQVAGAAYYVATGHPATIRVYWSQDIGAAVRAATADGCDVCSISWGSDEANWRAQNKQAGTDMELAATQATAAGMVVFAASGDNDSSDGGPTRANVDLPASAPHVIGCGGTTKTATTETVWNNDPGKASGEGTGGGFSTMFTNAELAGRSAAWPWAHGARRRGERGPEYRLRDRAARRPDRCWRHQRRCAALCRAFRLVRDQARFRDA